MIRWSRLLGLIESHYPRATVVRPPHAAAADITEMPKLLHGEERVVYGDRAYWKAGDRAAFEARGVATA